jgi:hypothetical protein
LIVTEHRSGAAGNFHGLLNEDFSIPESWASPRKRRAAAGSRIDVSDLPNLGIGWHDPIRGPTDDLGVL